MDYDGDGDIDLVTGSDNCCDSDRQFFLYRRGDDGQFQARESIRMRYDALTVMNRTRVCITDWNRDGQPDLILQRNEVPGLLVAPGPLADRAEIGISRHIEGSDPVRVIFTKPYVTDWDGDGLPDLLIGSKMKLSDGRRVYRGVYVLRRVDDAEGAKLAVPELLVANSNGAMITGLHVTDWDGDGLSDLLLGVTWRKRVDGAPRKLAARSQIWVYRQLPRG